MIRKVFLNVSLKMLWLRRESSVATYREIGTEMQFP